MKKLLFLSLILTAALSVSAQPYLGSGRGQIRELVNKCDSEEGPLADAAWPLLNENDEPVFPDEPWTYLNGLDPFKDALMSCQPMGILSTTESYNGKMLWGSGSWENYSYYLLHKIEWKDRNFLQKAGDENNIILEHQYTGNEGVLNDMRRLKTLDLSGNRFRNISIVGHGLMDSLQTVDLSGNSTLEYLSISGCPALASVKAEAGIVSVANNGLLFSQLAGFDVTAPNYTYAPQGNVARSFPVNKVDLSAEFAIGTTFTNWSEQPLAEDEGNYTFANSLVGRTITVTLNNSSFPDLTDLELSITLTDGEGYIIATAADLDDMRNHLRGSFIVTADIDMTDYIAEHYPEEGWLPIGDATAPFAGKIEGNGHVISGLWCKRAETDHVGLFGTLGYCRDITTDGGSQDVVGNDETPGVEISDLALIADSIIGHNNVGGLAGIIGNKSRITGVYVKAHVKGNLNTGGICGTYYGKNTATLIEDCYVAGSVTGVNKVGGVAGNAFNQEVAITINRVYTTNTVRNISGWFQDATGGFIGRYNAWYGLVKYTNCFAVNDTIDGINSSSTGRFVGNIVEQSKSTETTIYDFAENAFGLNVLSYRERDSSMEYRRITALETGEDGTGEDFEVIYKRQRYGFNVTAALLKEQATYEASGWDFSETWAMGNDEYPLPVLKKINAGKQPTAYPVYLDAKQAYSVYLEVDSDESFGVISLHNVFPYWSKDGIIEGSNVPVYIRAENGYELESLLVNGEEKKADISNNIYTISNISENMTVVGKFIESEEPGDGLRNTSAAKIGIYPNPAAHQLKIINYEPASDGKQLPVVITDLEGRTVISVDYGQSINGIDISALQPGMYLLRLGEETVKFMKK